MAKPDQPGQSNCIEAKANGAASSQEGRHQGEGQQRHHKNHEPPARSWEWHWAVRRLCNGLKLRHDHGFFLSALTHVPGPEGMSYLWISVEHELLRLAYSVGYNS